MNQIYKVIWSRVKHCYVVVSEIAGRCGKNGGTASEKKSMPVRAFLCALAVTGCLLPGMAEASFNGGIGATTATANSIAVGDDAKTTEEYTSSRQPIQGNKYLCHSHGRSGTSYRAGGDCHRIPV